MVYLRVLTKKQTDRLLSDVVASVPALTKHGTNQHSADRGGSVRTSKRGIDSGKPDQDGERKRVII
jgi:hypothetical protein